MWEAENTRGLSFATASAWSEAASAFSAAVESINADDDRESANADALALVLGNLAHACFLDDRVDEAIRHQQRACALRAAILGEDAISVARSRSDLAVMLASSGRIEEAPALIARAITAVEQGAGENDLKLAVVLENAARTLIASGQPAEAEPHIVRLRTLLSDHELSTDRADMLLDRVRSEAPGRPDVGLMSESASPAAATGIEHIGESASFAETEVSLESSNLIEASVTNDDEVVQHEEIQAPAAIDHDVVQHEEIDAPAAIDEVVWHDEVAQHEEINEAVVIEPDFEDDPLRDAVMLTDVLLRSTPSGMDAIRMQERESRAREDDRDSSADVVFGNVELASPTSPEDVSDDVGDDLSYESSATSELSLDGIELLATADIDTGDDSSADVNDARKSDSTGEDESSIADADPAGLGFIVQYGTPLDEELPLTDSAHESAYDVVLNNATDKDATHRVVSATEASPVDKEIALETQSEAKAAATASAKPITSSVPEQVSDAQPPAQQPGKLRAPRMVPLEETGSGAGKRVAIGAGIAALIAAVSWFLIGS